MDPDFEPCKAFKELDMNDNGLIEPESMIAALKKSYVRISDREAAQIIQEYDADEDGTLSFEEFCQIVLPSTNENLRRIA